MAAPSSDLAQAAAADQSCGSGSTTMSTTVPLTAPAQGAGRAFAPIGCTSQAQPAMHLAALISAMRARLPGAVILDAERANSWFGGQTRAVLINWGHQGLAEPLQQFGLDCQKGIWTTDLDMQGIIATLQVTDIPLLPQASLSAMTHV